MNPAARTGVRLPSKDQLEYARLLLTTLLIAIAVPLVLWHAFRDPKGTGQRMAGAGIPR